MKKSNFARTVLLFSFKRKNMSFVPNSTLSVPSTSIFEDICYTDSTKEREVIPMKRLAQKVLLLFISYGRFGAGAPSIHGSYEAPVPTCLKGRK